MTGILGLALLTYVLGTATTLRALAWVALGAFVGWLASLIMRTDTQGGIVLDIVAGAAGALGGLLLFGAVGEGGSLESFLSAVVGSTGLLAITGLARRAMRR